MKKPQKITRTLTIFSIRAWYNEHLTTGPKGNSAFCFIETLNVSRGKADGNAEIEGLYLPAKKSFTLHRLAHKFAVVLRSRMN